MVRQFTMVGAVHAPYRSLLFNPLNIGRCSFDGAVQSARSSFSLEFANPEER
jgi:hypothetical protein